MKISKVLFISIVLGRGGSERALLRFQIGILLKNIFVKLNHFSK